MDLVYFGSSIPEFACMKDSFFNAALVSFTFLLFSLYINNVHTVVGRRTYPKGVIEANDRIRNVWLYVQLGR